MNGTFVIGEILYRAVLSRHFNPQSETPKWKNCSSLQGILQPGHVPEATSLVINTPLLLGWVVEKHLVILSYNMQISIVVRLEAVVLATVQSPERAVTSF